MAVVIVVVVVVAAVWVAVAVAVALLVGRAIDIAEQRRPAPTATADEVSQALVEAGGVSRPPPWTSTDRTGQ